MEETKKSSENHLRFKRIQFNVEGDYMLGSDAMVSMASKIMNAGFKLDDLLKITKDGIIVEMKPIQIDDPEAVSLALALFMNQISIRGLVDNQTIARMLMMEKKKLDTASNAKPEEQSPKRQ